MNQKIIEFAEQCEGMTKCECGSTGFNYEKFAELIIKECVSYLESEITRLGEYANTLPCTEDGMQMQYEIDLVVEKCLDNINGIKKHFGVEIKL